MRRAVNAAAVAAGAVGGYVLSVRGALTLDLGVGRRTRQLGPLHLSIAAPRETVFDVVAAPYLGRTPRAMARSSKCSSARVVGPARPASLQPKVYCPAVGDQLRQNQRVEGAGQMSDSVYRVTEVIGVSSESWEAAASNAVETAARTLRDLRIAEVVRQDVTIENGKVTGYRVRLNLSFKYESSE